MTSETKVPMPEPRYPSLEDQIHKRNQYYTGRDVDEYGSARASERDAFWMAKVEVVPPGYEQDVLWWAKAIEDEEPTAAAMLREYATLLATLTNPRAGETA